MGHGTDPSVEVSLAQGLHTVTASPRLGAVLWWQEPGGEWQPVPRERLYHGEVRPIGLQARYFQGRGWAGTPALERIEPGAATYYQLPPLGFPFSVEWTGQLFAPSAGEYRFSVEAISEASLEIDARPVVSSTEPNVTREAAMTLAQGWHAIRVRHFAGAGYAHVFVRWLPPGGRWELIPPANMRPW